MSCRFLATPVPGPRPAVPRGAFGGVALFLAVLTAGLGAGAHAFRAALFQGRSPLSGASPEKQPAQWIEVRAVRFPAPRKAALLVRVADPDHCTTASYPDLARDLFRLFPRLADHRCENGKGYSFRHEADDTELPHLLEHLILELQSEAMPHGALKGETDWNWRREPRGLFHVYLDYESKPLLLASVRTGARLLNAVEQHQTGSIHSEREVARLRETAISGYPGDPFPAASPPPPARK
jgi:hypothetical protein